MIKFHDNKKIPSVVILNKPLKPEGIGKQNRLLFDLILRDQNLKHL